MIRAQEEARRWVLLARAFVPALEQARAVGTQQIDAQGFPLFVSEEGESTRERFAETLFRDSQGQPLFHPPPEMKTHFEPLQVRLLITEPAGHTHRDLWERHFVELPHGDRRLADWVRDTSNMVRIQVPLQPLLQPLRDHPQQLAARRGDAQFSLAQVDHVLGAQEPDSREAEVLSEVRAALLAAWRGIAGGELFSVPAPFQSLADIPEATLTMLARHGAGTLPERLMLAEALGSYLLSEPPREGLSLRWPREALLQAVHAEVGLATPGPDGRRILSHLLDAEAMAMRGVQALASLSGGSSDSIAEATLLAEELAVQSLRRALVSTS